MSETRPQLPTLSSDRKEGHLFDLGLSTTLIPTYLRFQGLVTFGSLHGGFLRVPPTRPETLSKKAKKSTFHQKRIKKVTDLEIGALLFPFFSFSSISGHARRPATRCNVLAKLGW